MNINVYRNNLDILYFYSWASKILFAKEEKWSESRYLSNEDKPGPPRYARSTVLVLRIWFLFFWGQAPVCSLLFCLMIGAHSPT